jgi:hypothetical protein
MPRTKNQQEKAVNWRERTTPVQPGEITDAMLDPVRRRQRENRLPQTVFPSKYFGPGFKGIDCLLVSAAAPLLDGELPESIRPRDAAGGSMPILTLLPPS